MMMKKIINPYFQALLLFLCCMSSCKKDWLDQKPGSNLVVLSSLSDYQASLDVQALHEYNNVGMVGELGSDNMYVPVINQESFFDVTYTQGYIWGGDALNPPINDDWTQAYSDIHICNVALDGISRIGRTAENGAQWDQLYATALFFRAYQYAALTQIYMKPYDSATVEKDLGVPLRLTLDLAAKVTRGTAKQVYDQVTGDLQKASNLLFTGPQAYQQLYEPTKAAAQAMLARVYLNTENYPMALVHADSALQQQYQLLDYNTIPSTGNVQLTMPYWYQNPEVFFYGALNNFIIYPGLVAEIDSSLYTSYSTNDLRKSLYFDTISYTPYVSFSGTYSGTSPSDLFSAVAVDELYLIRAECKARLNDVRGAMDDLNTLLVTRWKAGTYIPFTASNADEALRIILRERRKELVMRGTRWSDLRRLNKDPRFATTITRYTPDGVAHVLAPNSNLYTWPIPQAEITATGIEQNPR